MIQFSEPLKKDVTDFISESTQDIYELKLFCLIVDNCLSYGVEIALKIYFTWMVTNCHYECSFSKLKRIKNKVRATMGQKRLNHLSLMSIEHKLWREMNRSRIIDEFSCPIIANVPYE